MRRKGTGRLASSSPIGGKGGGGKRDRTYIKSRQIAVTTSTLSIDVHVNGCQYNNNYYNIIIMYTHSRDCIISHTIRYYYILLILRLKLICTCTCTLSIYVKAEEGLRKATSVVGNLKHVWIETVQVKDELG